MRGDYAAAAKLYTQVSCLHTLLFDTRIRSRQSHLVTVSELRLIREFFTWMHAGLGPSTSVLVLACT